METELYNKAVRIYRNICDQYNLLASDKYRFFETYHDTMLDQKDGAMEIVGEIEHYVKTDQIAFAKANIKELNKTLSFCKAVINLQEMTEKLPEPIFG